jgi:hypothetical protein
MPTIFFTFIYIYFLKCWHRLNEPQLQTSIYIIKYSFTITNHIVCTNLKRFMRDLYSIKYNILKLYSIIFTQ